jgi:hypothetical protein
MSHIDRPPLGDVANALSLQYRRTLKRISFFAYIIGRGEYVFDTIEIKEALEGHR